MQNTAMEVLELTQSIGIDIAGPIALEARQTALKTLRSAPVEVEIIVTDRKETFLPASEPKILILGGTAEAASLASAFTALPVAAITSLAGRTAAPAN